MKLNNKIVSQTLTKQLITSEFQSESKIYPMSSFTHKSLNNLQVKLKN
jgi:hypothetical protein